MRTFSDSYLYQVSNQLDPRIPTYQNAVSEADSEPASCCFARCQKKTISLTYCSN